MIGSARMGKKKTGWGGRREGAGRPDEYGGEMKVTFSVTMPISLAQWIGDFCDSYETEDGKQLSKSKVVVMACEEYRDRQERRTRRKK